MFRTCAHLGAIIDKIVMNLVKNRIISCIFLLVESKFTVTYQRILV